MRRLLASLPWVLALAACDAPPPRAVAIPLVPALRQALLAERIKPADTTAVLSIRALDAEQRAVEPPVFVSEPVTLVDLDKGFAVAFAGVPPGDYELSVTIATLFGGTTPSPLLTYRLNNVHLVAGEAGIQGQGSWSLTSAAAGGDADGDGISNFGEVMAGLDPAQRWSLVAAPPKGEQVVGVAGGDMRALFMVTGSKVLALGLQHATDLTTLGNARVQSLGTLGANTLSSATPGGCAGASLLSVSQTVCPPQTSMCQFLLGATAGCLVKTGVPMPTANVAQTAAVSRWYASLALPTGIDPPLASRSFVGIALGNESTGALASLFAVIDEAGTPFFERWVSDSYENAVQFGKAPLNPELGVVAVIPTARCGGPSLPDQTAYAVGVHAHGNTLSASSVTNMTAIIQGGSCSESLSLDPSLKIAAVLVPDDSAACEVFVVYNQGSVAAVERATLANGDCGAGYNSLGLQRSAKAESSATMQVAAITAARIGRAQALTDPEGRMNDFIILGDANGHVWAVGPTAAFTYPGGALPPWVDLGAVPQGGPILGIATDWRAGDDKSAPAHWPGTYPDGVIWSIFVATPSGIYRAP